MFLNDIAILFKEGTIGSIIIGILWGFYGGFLVGFLVFAVSFASVLAVAYIWYRSDRMTFRNTDRTAS